MTRLKKQQEKVDRRNQRQRERDQRLAHGQGGPEGDVEDPDLAGIVPGPQPPLEE